MLFTSGLWLPPWEWPWCSPVRAGSSSSRCHHCPSPFAFTFRSRTDVLLSQSFLLCSALPWGGGSHSSQREKAALSLHYMQLDTGASPAPFTYTCLLQMQCLKEGCLEHRKRLCQAQLQLGSRLESQAGIFLDQCNP